MDTFRCSSVRMKLFVIVSLLALTANSSSGNSVELYSSNFLKSSLEGSEYLPESSLPSRSPSQDSETVPSGNLSSRIYGTKSQKCSGDECTSETKNTTSYQATSSQPKTDYGNLTPNPNVATLRAFRECTATVSLVYEEASRPPRFREAEGVTSGQPWGSHSFVTNKETIVDTFLNLAPYYLPWPSSVPSLLRDYDHEASGGGISVHPRYYQDSRYRFPNFHGQSGITEEGHLKKHAQTSSIPKSNNNPTSILSNAIQYHSNDKNFAGTNHIRKPAVPIVSPDEVVRHGSTDQQHIEKEILTGQHESRTGLSEECDGAVTAMYDAFIGATQERDVDSFIARKWPLEFLDAWGKPEDGMLMGNLRALGFMEECLHTDGYYINKTNGHPVTFTGQYCTIEPHLQGLPRAGILPVLYGTCMPSTCTQQELTESVNKKLGELSYTAKDVWCRQRDAGLQWSTWEIVGSTMIGVMVFMVVLATILHAFNEKPHGVVKAFSAIENYKKISTVKMDYSGQISCFYGIRVLSICWIILGHQYAYMNGFGYNLLMMSWMTQEWGFQFIWTGYKAVDTFFTVGGLLATQAIIKMDFFGTSGLRKRASPRKFSNTPEMTSEVPKGHFTAKNSLPTTTEHAEMKESKASNSRNSLASAGQGEDAEIGQEGAAAAATGQTTEGNADADAPSLTASEALLNFSKTYVLYVIYRLMRLLPTMFLVVMFCAGPAALLVDGPYRRRYEDEYVTPCRTNWWVDLTLFSNIIFRVTGEKAEKDPDYGPVDSCVSHSWYLAVDFQLYLVAPLLLLPLKTKLNNYGIWYLSVVALVACLIPGSIVLAKDLLPAMLITLNEPATLDYSRKIYMMPYSRAAPYFIGGICGLLILQDQSAQVVNGSPQYPAWRQLLASKMVRACGWLVFAIAMTSITFGLYGRNEVSLDLRHISDTGSFFYAAFATAAWAVCIGWLVVLCTLRLADPLNDFLSHPFWQVPGRITYPVYLISLPIQKWVFYSLLRDVYLSHLTFVLSYCGVLVITFLAAFFISLVAEAPYIGLSKILLTSSAASRNKHQ